MRKFASILLMIIVFIFATITDAIAQQYTGFQIPSQPKASNVDTSASSIADTSATVNQLSNQNKAKLQKKIDDIASKVPPPPAFVDSTPPAAGDGSAPQTAKPPTTTSMPTNPAVIGPPPTTAMPGTIAPPPSNTLAPAPGQQGQIYTGFGGTNKPNNTGTNTGTTKNQGWNIRY